MIYIIYHLYFKIRRDNGENFILEPRLWVGRREEPILGCISEFDEK